MNSFLDDIDEKMNQLLNNQLQNCYNYSSIVMMKYKELLVMFSVDDTDDMLCYFDMIEELKEYVLKEYDAYEKLLLYDKNRLISKIDSLINDSCDSVEYMRFRSKLQFTKNIFLGYQIRASQLSIDDVPGDLRFDIYSVLLSTIHVKTFISIKDKIDSISFVEGNEEFIKALEDKLLSKLLYRACGTDLFEIMVLYNSFNIEKFSDVNMDALKKVFSKIYLNTDIDEHINEILFNLIISDISNINKIKKFNNCPEDVFTYLYFITRIEVIISFMNRTNLQKLYDCCNEINFNNMYIAKDVRQKIKRKIKE